MLNYLRLGSSALTRAFGSTAGRAAAGGAAAGATGGVLLDDVPLIGEALDPTEGGNNQQQQGSGMNETLILLMLAGIVAVWALNEVSD